MMGEEIKTLLTNPKNFSKISTDVLTNNDQGVIIFGYTVNITKCIYYLNSARS